MNDNTNQQARPFSREVDLSYRVSDAEFIRRTRTSTYHDASGKGDIKGTIHDPEVQKLFWANGGDVIADDYNTLAQALEALRRFKLARLGSLGAQKYNRSGNLDKDYRVVHIHETVEQCKQRQERCGRQLRQAEQNRKWIGQ